MTTPAYASLIPHLACAFGDSHTPSTTPGSLSCVLNTQEYAFCHGLFTPVPLSVPKLYPLPLSPFKCPAAEWPDQGPELRAIHALLDSIVSHDEDSPLVTVPHRALPLPPRGRCRHHHGTSV